MNAHIPIGLIGKLVLCAVAAGCLGTTAVAQEGPLYNCPPGYLWTNGGCIAASASRPAQQKQQMAAPKAHSLAPGNPNVQNMAPISHIPPTTFAPESNPLSKYSKPQAIPPKLAKPSGPPSLDHGALNPQPIPPGYPPKPLLQSGSGKTR